MLTSFRNFFLLTVGVALLAGVFYLMMKTSGTTPTSASAGAYIATTTQVRSATDFAWYVENASDYSDTSPNQLVSLMVGTTTYPIGTYQGCEATPDGVALEPSEIIRETCWFAGAGTDIGLFFENGVYTVQTRWTQEVPPDVDAEPHGPFETILTL